MSRQPIGKRLRFQIFNRDDFTCTYCGRSAPEVVLHVDHIWPLARGGSNHPSNLKTACKDCNLGKATALIGNGAREIEDDYDDELQVMTCDPYFMDHTMMIE